MREKKVYKWLFKQYIKRVAYLVMLMGILLGIDSYYHYRLVQTSERVFASFSSGYIVAAIFLMGSGIWYSYKQYPGLLSIQAKRYTYLRGITFVGIGGSILLGTITFCMTYIVIECMKKWANGKVIVESFELSIWGLVSMVGFALVLFALGFFIGALFYRLNRWTAACLISIGPIVCVMSILSYFLWQNEWSMQWMYIMLFLAKSLIGGIGQIIYLIAFWVGGYALLWKAPTINYAHDLI